MGEGRFKVFQVLPRKGCVFLSPPSSFREFLEVTLELAPNAPKALRTHSGARLTYTQCTQIQVLSGTHSASPLLSKQPD